MVIDKIQGVTLNPTRSPGTARVSYRSIFISPGWQIGDDYDRLVKLLNQGLGLNQWQNLSAEQNCQEHRAGGPSAPVLDELIGRAGVVIVLSGLYQQFRDAIQKETAIATRLGIPILSVVPWGQQSSPEGIRGFAALDLPWACNRICNAVKQLG
ncbi:MAG: hypothetical protein HOO19_11965 [Rhodospirillaceae bacterium]|nr:hypothetical protein [Rhodospirillaceae bacterium]MBT3885248.1 hypothetical protein [Rhodospirillaceae bacterium]MBT4115706.1 hypothetical protein [Rhodospirillaceae bacterium]MBT4673399.1 hypothetical protein [Rhodospirillaceae bacterium]MBT4719744.1 hypothetical protein [Rhodospirillaceae bacterium]